MQNVSNIVIACLANVSFYFLTARVNVTEVIVRSMKSPRSALCKTSIMASADIFHCFGHLLLFTTEKNSFGQLVISHSLRWHFYSLLKHITFANIVCK